MGANETTRPDFNVGGQFRTTLNGRTTGDLGHD
jgi:hypothetical protein